MTKQVKTKQNKKNGTMLFKKFFPSIDLLILDNLNQTRYKQRNHWCCFQNIFSKGVCVCDILSSRFNIKI